MDPLAQLHDISTIQDTSVWPLAWGYWFLFVLCLALIVCAFFFVKRHRDRQKRLRMQIDFLTQAAHYSDLNIRFRQVIQSQSPRSPLLYLSGIEFLSAINHLLPEEQQHQPQKLARMADALYQPDQQAPFESLLALAIAWSRYQNKEKL